jgi:hypothetical protein
LTLLGHHVPSLLISLSGLTNLIIYQDGRFKREGTSLPFRWELYNVFNHTQFSDVDTDAQFNASGGQNDQRFGKVIAARCTIEAVVSAIGLLRQQAVGN